MSNPLMSGTVGRGSFLGLRRDAVITMLVIALAQSAVLGWMVYKRVTMLQSGRVIELPIVPVDPRHIFKGDYVRLAYPINRLATSLLKGDAPEPNQPFYVTLERSGSAVASGDWVPITVSKTFQQPTSKNRIVLKARIRSRWRRVWPAGSMVTVKYGIESYFLEEGTGLRLEKLVLKKKLTAQIAVDADGEAAIKGLLIDGKLQYEEPLF